MREKGGAKMIEVTGEGEDREDGGAEREFIAGGGAEKDGGEIAFLKGWVA